MIFNILLKIKPTKLPGKLYAIPFERVDKADTLQTESSLSELSVENKGLSRCVRMLTHLLSLARRSTAPALAGSGFCTARPRKPRFLRQRGNPL